MNDKGMDDIFSALLNVMGQSISTLSSEQRLRFIMWVVEASLRYKISPQTVISRVKEVEKILKEKAGK